MNNEFKLKLLQNLSRKKEDGGFTLIELLVVVIIIGVLAAIALPNLLGQVGKARESEAKNVVGALNRAQQAYFTEKASFTSDIDLLEVPTGNETYYTFTVPANGTQLATGKNQANNGTRDYVGGVSYNSTNRTFKTALCRAKLDASTKAPKTLVAGDVSNAGSTAAASQVDCGATNTEKID